MDETIVHGMFYGIGVSVALCVGFLVQKSGFRPIQSVIATCSLLILLEIVHVGFDRWGPWHAGRAVLLTGIE